MWIFTEKRSSLAHKLCLALLLSLTRPPLSPAGAAHSSTQASPASPPPEAVAIVRAHCSTCTDAEEPPCGSSQKSVVAMPTSSAWYCSQASRVHLSASLVPLTPQPKHHQHRHRRRPRPSSVLAVPCALRSPQACGSLGMMVSHRAGRDGLQSAQSPSVFLSYIYIYMCPTIPSR